MGAQQCAFTSGFKQTKHDDKVNKKVKLVKCLYHRTFSVHTYDTDIPNQYSPTANSHSSGYSVPTNGTPVGTVHSMVGARACGKSQIMMTTFPSIYYGGLSYERSFKHQQLLHHLKHTNNITNSIKEHHNRVCGCKTFQIAHIQKNSRTTLNNVGMTSSALRVSCKKLDLLEFECALDDQLGDFFNGKRNDYICV